MAENKLKTIEDVRDFSLETLEKLRDKKIEWEIAATTGKIIEGVISSVKTQLLYAEMTGQEPDIAFMGGIPARKVVEMKGSLKSMARLALDDKSTKKKKA